MNKLSREKQVQIITCLVEGNSLRSTARICDVAFNSVLNLLPRIGIACADYQDRTLRNLKCKRIQCDEIWQFCYAKEKNVPADKRGQFGLRGRLDVGCNGCRHKAHRDVGDWNTRMREQPLNFMDDLAGRLAIAYS